MQGRNHVKKKWIGQFERAHSREGHHQLNLTPNPCFSSDFGHYFFEREKIKIKSFEKVLKKMKFRLPQVSSIDVLGESGGPAVVLEEALMVRSR